VIMNYELNYSEWVAVDSDKRRRKRKHKKKRERISYKRL